MWLLNTSNAVLTLFDSLEAIPGPYAILSHTWDRDTPEQTFQELRWQNIHVSGVYQSNPRDLVRSPKIRNFCAFAETEGYAWAWADTCCIDRTSSADISEAIVSMYTYYSRAAVCYAYLSDVPAGDMPRKDGSAFQRSRWHTRGWTLQELLASPNIRFLSSEWTDIGGKSDLAPVLYKITGIPVKVLTSRKSLSRTSVAARLSWAALRSTTRPEDEAYCLL